MQKHLIWTHRAKLLVIWNPNLRWDYWNFGDINSATGAWISRGRARGQDAAKKAAEEYVDGLETLEALKK